MRLLRLIKGKAYLINLFIINKFEYIICDENKNYFNLISVGAQVQNVISMIKASFLKTLQNLKNSKKK